MKALEEKITKDYTEILELSIADGVEKQRLTVCKPIYDPIEKWYKAMEGYIDEANLGLGCGFPFLFVDIKSEMQVLDLGCATGIDNFIVSKKMSNSGKVTGVDITESLIKRAKTIALNHQIENTHFIHSKIENLTLEKGTIDVAISNGVFSLIPELNKAFEEVYRVLKAGGNFCFADIVNDGAIEPEAEKHLRSFTGCLNGIRSTQDYVKTLTDCEFKNIEIKEERVLEIPTDVARTEKDVKIITIKAEKK